MSAPTPGPWVARPDPHSYTADDYCIGVAGDDRPIDIVATCSKHNACLIAAAPDLLDALKRVEAAALRPGSELHRVILAAIAKATPTKEPT